MRTKKVTRYYCDHCGKGKFKRPDMEAHEQSCTRNLNRHCGLCNREWLAIAALAKEMVDRGEDDECLLWLRNSCGHCPSCMLAVIQYAGRELGEWMFRPNADPGSPMFDYKKERDDFRDEQYRNSPLYP
jgi:hypothetical protein